MISLPLDIPDIKVLQTKISRAGDIVITVESTVKGTKCRQCGRKIDKPHGHDKWIELQHLPILGRRSYIRLRQNGTGVSTVTINQQQHNSWNGINPDVRRPKRLKSICCYSW